MLWNAHSLHVNLSLRYQQDTGQIQSKLTKSDQNLQFISGQVNANVLFFFPSVLFSKMSELFSVVIISTANQLLDYFV